MIIYNESGKQHEIASSQTPTLDFKLDGPSQLSLEIPVKGFVAERDNVVTITGKRDNFRIYAKPGKSGTRSDLQLDGILTSRPKRNWFDVNLSGDANFEFAKIEPLKNPQLEMKRGEVWLRQYDNGMRTIGRNAFHDGGYQVKHRTWLNERQNRNYCIVSRPKLIGADGREFWGTVSYSKAFHRLRYEFDPRDLDRVAYPAILDPTFGDTSTGPDTFPMSNDRALATRFTAADSSMTLSKFTAYLDDGGSHDPYKAWAFDNAAGEPSSRVALSSSTSTVSTPTWMDFTCTDSISSSGEYHLGVVGDGFSSEVYKDASGGNDMKMANGTFSYASPPASWPGTDASYGGQGNIYATYTTGGGGGGSAVSIRLGLLGVGF